jgi:hypothetical protein
MPKKLARGAVEFKIPVDLVKAFKTDVRFVPQHLPNNGYMVFDHAMLSSILLSDDVEARRTLARQLNELNRSGGQLVVMAAR